jgi:hypothetical protein
MLLYGGRGESDPSSSEFALAVISVMITTSMLAAGAFVLSRRRRV